MSRDMGSSFIIETFLEGVGETGGVVAVAEEPARTERLFNIVKINLVRGKDEPEKVVILKGARVYDLIALRGRLTEALEKGLTLSHWAGRSREGEER
ncbi:MAG TPA: hypothetical protein ENH11_00470 [Candidatus Acetothermia bacterium]|nr:hypothetical protein [Candidatus Acetothermia bacterium]